MSEIARILQPRESCKLLSAAEQLEQFARMHGSKGAHVKLIGGPALTKETSNPFAQTKFKAMVKKSVIATTVISRDHNLVDLKERSDEEESSSDEDSESEHEGEEPSQVDHQGKQPQINPSMNTDSAKKSHRLSSMDGIGKASVNTLGSNLLPNARSSFDTDPSNSSPITRGITLFQTKVDLSSSALIQGFPRKNSLKPIAKLEDQRKSTLNILNKFFSPASMSALPWTHGSSDSVDHKSIAGPTLYTVDFQGESLYIPGCHGNSVIRFDFYDGE